MQSPCPYPHSYLLFPSPLNQRPNNCLPAFCVQNTNKHWIMIKDRKTDSILLPAVKRCNFSCLFNRMIRIIIKWLEQQLVRFADSSIGLQILFLLLDREFNQMSAMSVICFITIVKHETRDSFKFIVRQTWTRQLIRYDNYQKISFKIY